MASFQRTFQKRESHNAEYHSLQGVEVRIGKRFTTPKKVTLPVGWQQRDPSLVLGLTYDFSFEKEVISKAEALKVKQTEHEATTGTESETTSTSVEAHQSQNAIFSNVGNEILQPVVAAGMGHRKKDSFGGKGNNSFDLADFEGDTSTPFELVELQTINDLDELKNVLEPCTAQEEVAESFITSNDRRPADVPSSNVGNQCPSRNSIAEAPAPVVKPTALPSTRQLHSSCKNYSVHGASGCTYTNSASKGSYLVNIGDSTIMSQAPAAMSTSGCTVTTTSYATNPLFHSTNDLNSRPVSRGGLLPPLGSSQPWPVPQPYQTSTCVSNSSHSHNQGISTAPTRVANREQYLDICAKGNEREALITYVKDNPGVSSPSSRSSEHQNAVQFCPSPLPPIGLSSEEPRKHHGKEPHVSTYQSSLPDPWPILTDGEKSLVTNIASMGFPTPRVSRGVQRIGLKEGEVIEFLVAVDELSGAGYEPDSAEVALVFSNSEKAKAVEFLELVHTFKEYGFEEENIQEALQAANSDREKALEYLMTLSTG